MKCRKREIQKSGVYGEQKGGKFELEKGGKASQSIKPSEKKRSYSNKERTRWKIVSKKNTG